MGKKKKKIFCFKFSSYCILFNNTKKVASAVHRAASKNMCWSYTDLRVTPNFFCLQSLYQFNTLKVLFCFYVWLHFIYSAKIIKSLISFVESEQKKRVYKLNQHIAKTVQVCRRAAADQAWLALCIWVSEGTWTGQHGGNEGVGSQKCGAAAAAAQRSEPCGYFYLGKAPIPRGKGWHDYPLSSGKILPSQNNN